MQKSKRIQMIAAAILTIIVAGCGASKDEVPPMQQESVAGTDIEAEETKIEDIEEETKIEDIEIEETKIEDIEIEETQTDTETGSVIQTGTTAEQGTVPETETQTHTESQTEMQPKAEVQQTAAEGSVSASDYMVSVRGTAVALQGDMRDFVSVLGEPDGYSAAKSCVEAGEDKIYMYGGITIYTYVTNGADRITLIEITGSEALPSGIHVGSTKADVIAAYGSSYTEEGAEILYETDGKTLGLQMEGDTVSFIELFGR